MNRIQIIVVTILLLLTTIGNAQEKGSLFLRVLPKKSTIRMGEISLKSYETYTLDTGIYTIKMWMSKREYVERTITIKAGKTEHLVEVLSYSENYKKFKRKKFGYNVNKIALRYAPPVVLGIFVANTLSTWSSLNDDIDNELNLAIIAKDRYSNEVVQSEFQEQKETYNKHRIDYEKNIDKYNQSRKNRVIIGTTLILTSIALEYFSFKLTKPKYSEKVLLSSLTFNNYNNNISPAILLAYKF